MSVPDVLSPQERLVLGLRGLYESCGYTRFPMRRFEEYALYSENKSFLPSESVLSFTNANGRLMALKPDVTLSIVKRARAERGQVEKLYYHESVYRVSPTDHEFTEIGQLGVELLGEADLYGTCEVLRLAIESLRLTGARFVLDISHMGFAASLLAGAGLDGAQRSQASRLIRQKNAHELARVLSQWQVPPFYAERIANLPTLGGSFTQTLDRAADIAVGEEMRRAIGELSSLYAALDALGLCAHVRLDFSIINDLDYYNGLVFQGYVEGAPRVVLSGGRYDKLMRKFGKAGDGLGFALYLDELQRVIARPAGDDVDALVLYTAQDSVPGVLHALDALREQGRRVLAAQAPPPGLRAGKTLRYRDGALEEVSGAC